jgi:hypothetical protein
MRALRCKRTEPPRLLPPPMAGSEVEMEFRLPGYDAEGIEM